MIEPLAIDASSLVRIREQKPNSNARDRLALVRQENRILAEPSFERQHAELEEAVSKKTVGAKVTSREHESGLPITLNGTRLLP